jgi:iron complex outermembrane receptor protein
MRSTLPCIRCSAIAALFAASAPALAQPAAPAPAASAPSGATVTTVEITGQRERERYRRAFRPPAISAGVLGQRDVLDTPFSVNAFNRELFELQQAVTASDVLKNDPSVTSSSTPGDSALYAQIRGFDAGGLIDGLQHEAIRPNQRNASLFNVERIDVLKGVSAFLYGGTARMPIGGAINYVTKRPTAEPLTQFAVGLGERSRWLLQGDVSRRFGEGGSVGLRLNAATQRGDTPIDGQNFRTDVAAVAADWRVSDAVVLRAAAEHYEARDRAYRDRYGINGGIAVPKAPDPRTNHSQRWGLQFNRGWSAQVGADWQIAPDWKLSLRHLQGNEPERGYDSSYAQIVSAAGDLEIYPGVSRGSLKGDTSDVLLRGYVETGPLTHELAFNASRSYSRFEFPVEPQNYVTIVSNLYTPVFVERPEFLPVTPVEGIVSRSTGFSASDIVSFGSQWSALLGLRHQRIEGRSFFSPSFDNEKTSPVLALMWKPVPRTLLYVHRAEGLESGPVAPDSGVSNPNEAFPARVSRQIEAGARSGRAPTSCCSPRRCSTCAGHSLSSAPRPARRCRASSSPGSSATAGSNCWCRARCVKNFR